MHHKTLKHPLPQSLVHIINDDIQRKNATYLPAQSPAHKINEKDTTLTYNICSSSQLLIKTMLKSLKKNVKEISMLLHQLTYEINDKIYFLQERKKSASALLQNHL